ncbi:MAG: hypothetical protein SGJ20_19600 [Planctomycetota bacterium]|nr:hypothetical protein [Planctomycetota bacterium]
MSNVRPPVAPLEFDPPPYVPSPGFGPQDPQNKPAHCSCWRIGLAIFGTAILSVVVYAAIQFGF